MRWRIAIVLVGLVACGTSTGSSDGAGGGGASGVAGGGGGGNAGTGGSAGSAGAGGASSGTGGTAVACHFNADCQAGQVCYIGLDVCSSASLGRCVARASTACSGCNCLSIGASECPPSINGSICLGNDASNSCWYCYLPAGAP